MIVLSLALSGPDLESFLKRTFPKLENYQEKTKEGPSGLLISFTWNQENFYFIFEKGKIFGFFGNACLSLLLMKKQLRIDELEKMLDV